MKLHHIDRLVGTVPTTIDQRQRDRLHGYAEMASRCEARIQRLRADLEQSLQNSHGSIGTAAQAFTEPNTALSIATELDALERVQPRVDAWFTDYVAALVAAHTTDVDGDGTPM
jgi:hypothetical protein